jgi:hypothetical protein
MARWACSVDAKRHQPFPTRPPTVPPPAPPRHLRGTPRRRTDACTASVAHSATCGVASRQARATCTGLACYGNTSPTQPGTGSPPRSSARLGRPDSCGRFGAACPWRGAGSCPRCHGCASPQRWPRNCRSPRPATALFCRFTRSLSRSSRNITITCSPAGWHLK